MLSSSFILQSPVKCASLALAFLALALLWTQASCAHSVSASIQEDEIPALEGGAKVEREIAGGKKHTYRITLASSQFLRVTVDQRDVDIFIKLIGTDGNQTAMAGNILDPMRTERLSFVAKDYGDYRLEVIANETEEIRGSYQLRVEPVRVATTEDKNLMQAENLCSEAEQLLAQGKAESIRQAIIKYEQSLALWQQAGDRRGEADAVQYLAVAHRRIGETEKAIEHLTQALSLYRAAEERRGESQVLQGLGLMNHLTGDVHKALEYYNQTLPMSREMGDRGGEATALNNIGGVYSYMGEQQKALEYYALSLPLHKTLGNKVGEATTLNNIGEIYRTLGEYDRAIEHFDKSLSLRRETKDIRGEGVTLNNIGLTYSSLSQYQKALDYLGQSLALRRTTGDRSGEAFTLNNTGFVYHKLGEHDKALEFFNQALKLRQAVADRRGEANTLHHIGSVYSSMGDTQKAMEYFNRALPLTQAVGDRIVETATLYSMARIERDRGRFIEARARMESSLAIIESLRSMVSAQELRETFFASKQDHYELYIDVLMQMSNIDSSASYMTGAFEASERARARALLDILTEARADIRQAVPASLIERERLLQQQINARERLRMQTAGRRNSEKQMQEAEAEIGGLLNQYKEVRVQIRAANPRYAALKDPQPLGLEEIQRLLDHETILLEYSLGDKRSYLWMVTPTSITGHAIASRQEIEEAARRVYELLTARNQRLPLETSEQKRARIAKADDEYHSAASHLSRLLLAPVARELGSKRLLVVSQGALQYVPFAALLSIPSSATEAKDKGEGTKDSYKPLIVDHEIIHLPSASVLALLREDRAGRRQPDKSVAVLADPVFDPEDSRVAASLARIKNRQPNTSNAHSAVSLDLKRLSQDFGISGFRRLRFSRQEADAISALAAESHTLKAVDFAASRATVIGGDLSRYRIIHFATHGLINTQHPELSGIVFSLVDENGQAQDGFLRLHEIYNLRLNADLVVLSACQSALGKEVRGEGLVGLTRGFMYAGAGRVVASLWSVEDRITADLMKRFYSRLLKEGLRPAAALRAAQVEMFSHKSSQSPYHWAGFIIQGEWK